MSGKHIRSKALVPEALSPSMCFGFAGSLVHARCLDSDLNMLKYCRRFLTDSVPTNSNRER